jgi:hypothetical protein
MVDAYCKDRGWKNAYKDIPTKSKDDRLLLRIAAQCSRINFLLTTEQNVQSHDDTSTRHILLEMAYNLQPIEDNLYIHALEIDRIHSAVPVVIVEDEWIEEDVEEKES